MREPDQVGLYSSQWTVIVVEFVIDPAVAVIAAVPAATPRHVPLLVPSLLTVAIPGFDELQIAEDNGDVVPSLNVPVANIFWLAPMRIVGFTGDTEIDRSVGEVG